jgi:hypothetical protein
MIEVPRLNGTIRALEGEGGAFATFANPDINTAQGLSVALFRWLRPAPTTSFPALEQGRRVAIGARDGEPLRINWTSLPSSSESCHGRQAHRRGAVDQSI